MRAAIYALVSTSNRGQSPDMKSAWLAEAGKGRGIATLGPYVELYLRSS